ncbi:MAG: metallophosphoesterase [Bacteroidetes bacterium]|nr:MAG: metallophosphoesterase [Bacteroidota bacterium]
MKIGLISDTHSFFDPKITKYFDVVDEIWHAGDIGNKMVLEQLKTLKPTRAVFGNIDDLTMQKALPEHLIFDVNGFKVYITHIGGNFEKFSRKISETIKNEQPNLFICGHSHIVKIRTLPQFNNLICINPGAAGNEGFHIVKTIMTFEINNKKLENLKLIELGKRGAIPAN